MSSKQRQLEKIAKHQQCSVEEYLAKCTPTFDCELTGNHEQVDCIFGPNKYVVRIDVKLKPLLEFVNSDFNATNVSCQYNWKGHAVVVFTLRGYQLWVEKLVKLGKIACRKAHPDWFLLDADLSPRDLQAQTNIEDYVRNHEFIKLFLTHETFSHCQLDFTAHIYECYYNPSLEVVWTIDASYLPWVDQQISDLQKLTSHPLYTRV